MSGFSAEGIEVGTFGKYQSSGVSEVVKITEVKLNENAQYNTTSIQLLTVNGDGQEGRSKKLSLNTTVSEGKTVSAWTVTAKYLLNILMSIGMSEEQAKSTLEAKDKNDLVNRLSKAMVGQAFRGLFSSREYEPGKFAIELYVTEPVGGTKLKWDENNRFYNQKLPKVEGTSNNLPF